VRIVPALITIQFVWHFSFSITDSGAPFSALAIRALWKMGMDCLVHTQANSAVPSIRNELAGDPGRKSLIEAEKKPVKNI
jgi:hypothetical protein